MSDETPVNPERASGVDPRLLEILICPVSRQPLSYDRAAGELISKKAGLAYPIRGGIPIMLADEARDLNADDHGGDAA
ncbi:Trm112 family protein [Hyphomonas oceanitis]|uniref:UPF0434 protein HOC_10893 n=1 Tax=Hyphomonas oceanitis SCH89 TaxID=1280953 RepID=A0A059G713_9PROT|nr:Trm112 family protein [Hyphomonas oceanitis]KDA02263.1 hypothetical protein HOC_10893 [Hyphomonas oceanitis SCH89]